MCCQAGCILSDISSMDQILTASVIFKMAFAALIVAAPGILMRSSTKKTKLAWQRLFESRYHGAHAMLSLNPLIA